MRTSYVRGKGVMRNRHSRMPQAVRMNIRMGQNKPLTVVHEWKGEFRSSPGTQGVVAVIGERLFPESSFSGKLVDHVNRSTTLVRQPYAALLPQYSLATADAPLERTVNHRMDWTMFTCGSWRDGYAFANGQFNNPTAMSVGYITPFIAAATTTDYEGTPGKWYEAPAVLLDPTGATREAALEENPDNPSTAQQMAVLCKNYYHLYEELSWKFTNSSMTGVSVTIYECILTRDIPIRETLPNSDSGTQGVFWGGMPCPIELWRQSQQISSAQNAGLTADGDLYMTSLPTNPIAAAENEGTGVYGLGTTASGGFFRDPTSGAAAAGLAAKDIDAPNVTPKRAQLLHSYYRVVPHTRYVPPGATTTITVGVKYNKRIPGAWWNSFYAISGLSRCFFMVTRPDQVVGLTNLDEVAGTALNATCRLPVMNATDLMVQFTKKKTVCKTKQRTRHVWRYKAAVPEIDDVVVRNPVTYKVHDANAPIGEGAEDAEAPVDR